MYIVVCVCVFNEAPVFSTMIIIFSFGQNMRNKVHILVKIHEI